VLWGLDVYESHYELQERLEQEPRILPAPVLYPFDDRAVYAAMLDRLAQPLPTGAPSPFSARTPTSAESQLIGTLVHLLSLQAHEVNLLPELVWIQLFRALGVQLLPSEYPVVSVTFTRSPGAPRAYVPAGLEVRSTRSNLVGIVLEDREINDPETSITVPCRLNQPGAIEGLPPGELTLVPQLSTGLESAWNDGTVLFSGRNPETLVEAMLRARLQFQRGLRCVTVPDFYNSAIEAGAKKVNVLPGVVPGVPGLHSDQTTVIVYPAELTSAVDAAIRPRILTGSRFQAYGAEIVPVNGRIEVRGTTTLSDDEARQMAVEAIVQQVNPPFGDWGDQRFDKTVATAIENERGVYAVPRCDLRHAETGQPISELQVEPWQLLEIQADTEIFAV
jgi:hypothetical protein